jgi:hypothetical protein
MRKGRVDCARGDMTLQLTVDANSDGTMGGQWAIISGLGGLRHVRGVGTWVFTRGGDVCGYADYQGVAWSAAPARHAAPPPARARLARPW